MTQSLTQLERRVLATLAEREDVPPGGLAIELDADLGRVLDAVATLRERGLLARVGFATCRLTDRGREAAAATAAE